MSEDSPNYGKAPSCPPHGHAWPYPLTDHRLCFCGKQMAVNEGRLLRIVPASPTVERDVLGLPPMFVTYGGERWTVDGISGEVGERLRLDCSRGTERRTFVQLADGEMRDERETKASPGSP